MLWVVVVLFSHFGLSFQPDQQSCENTVSEYKRVAIVDDFFDIIYGVHVEMDGRGGKHAGQKRTYRAVISRSIR